jgi:hypothetical protein
MIFELIQVAFGYRLQLSRQLSLEEWREVYEQADKQAVVGIVFDGVQKLPKEQWPPQAVLFEWIGQTEQIKQQNRKVNAVQKELALLFNANGIRYAVVKGQIVGSYYSDPKLRQAGDIDYYVEEQDFERAKQLIESTWGVTFEETEGHHHIEFEFKGIPFEQHHTLIKLYNKEKNNYWERLMKGAFESMEMEGVKVSVLPPTLHSLYIFLHLYHHLLELGVGLRQFCDWAAILHTYNRSIDHDAIRKHLEVLGIARAYRACGCLLIDYLGLPEDEFTYEVNSSDKQSAECILDVVMYRGNMGHYNLKGGHQGLWHNLEATGIKMIHFLKFMPLAPAFSWNWLLAELKRKISKKMR